MSFSNPGSGQAATGSATGDKFSKSPQQAHGPNFGQRLGQYMVQRNPLVGGLMEQVFGQPQAPIQHDTYGFGTPAASPMPMLDESKPTMDPTVAPMAKGLNFSGVLKALMGGV